MSKVRVHNVATSLDGFGTGDVQTLDAAFGHAGACLHECMFRTRFPLEMGSHAGGSAGADHRHGREHVAE